MSPGSIRFDLHFLSCSRLRALISSRFCPWRIQAFEGILIVAYIILHAPAHHQAGFVQLPGSQLCFELHDLAGSFAIGICKGIQPP